MFQLQSALLICNVESVNSANCLVANFTEIISLILSILIRFVFDCFMHTHVQEKFGDLLLWQKIMVSSKGEIHKR